MSYYFVVTLGLAGIITVLLYAFLVEHFRFWKHRRVIGPRPTLFFGNFKNMVLHLRSVAYDMQDIYKQYKNEEHFVGVYSLRTPKLMVTNASLAHKILVTDFQNFRFNEATTWVNSNFDTLFGKDAFLLRDKIWKETRQEVMTALTTDKIKAGFPATKEACDQLIDYMKIYCTKPRNSKIDIKYVCLRYTTEVMANFVLGLKAKSFSKNPSIPLAQKTKKLFEGTRMYTFYAFLADFWPPIRRIYKAKIFKPDMEKFFTELITTTFEERRTFGSDRLDFVAHILNMQDQKIIVNEQAISHALTFLLDGLETSAAVIAACLYQLSKYPEKQKKLREEILNIITEKGEIDFDNLQKMTYLDQCLHESIRLIPPILYSTKLCTELCELVSKNGKRVTLQPGIPILIPIYAIHHDEQYYYEPEEFIPERFSPENGGHKKFSEMGAFLPFGDGPRMCLGMKFALTQTKLAIAEIVRNFNVRFNPKSRADNRLRRAYFIGTLQGGIWLDFEERI